MINGKNQQTIDFSDRGFHYGDGLFETLEIQNGRAVFLEHHLKRLASGCQRLLIPIPNQQKLKQQIRNLTKNQAEAVLKIVVTRGSGGRGYRQPETINATQALSLYPFPAYPLEYISKGVNICFCETPLGLNPRLAGIKHLNKLEQVLARAEWQDPDIQEGLMFDSNHNLIEGTMSNVFLIEAGSLLTPKLDQCGVEGIIRNIIIELAMTQGLTVKQVQISQSRILEADEVFITNTIIGLWPVKKIGDHHYSLGRLTKQLATSLGEYKSKDLENDL